MLNLQLGQMPEGDLVIASADKLPFDVRRVEYYRDQKLFMLVYEDENHEGELVHYELTDANAKKLNSKSNIIIVEPDENGSSTGYYASLIQVGSEF